uniref:Uncharacterized protein n=1 Tax=Streptomyces sp. NBC_00003 TaxID=2903608 RepID=A0AAU2V8X0_9ACTN
MFEFEFRGRVYAPHHGPREAVTRLVMDAVEEANTLAAEARKAREGLFGIEEVPAPREHEDDPVMAPGKVIGAVPERVEGKKAVRAIVDAARALGRWEAAERNAYELLASYCSDHGPIGPSRDNGPSGRAER